MKRYRFRFLIVVLLFFNALLSFYKLMNTGQSGQNKEKVHEKSNFTTRTRKRSAYGRLVKKYENDEDCLCPGPPLRPFKPDNVDSAAQPMVKLNGLNVSICTIPKVSSTSIIRVTTYIAKTMQLIKKPLKLKANSSDMHDEFQSLGQPTSKNWIDKNWHHLIIVRDPIERFVSAFGGVCVKQRGAYACPYSSVQKAVQGTYTQFLALDRFGKVKRDWTQEVCKVV